MYISILVYSNTLFSITGGIIQHHYNNEHFDHVVQVIGYDFITGMYTCYNYAIHNEIIW